MALSGTGGAPNMETNRFLAELDNREQRKQEGKPLGVATYEKWSVSHLFHAAFGKTMTVMMGSETKIVNKSSMEQFLQSNFRHDINIKELSGQKVSQMLAQIAAKSPNLTSEQKAYLEQINKTPISVEQSKDITAPKDRMMSFVQVLENCGIDLKSKKEQWFPKDMKAGDMVTIKASEFEDVIKQNKGTIDPNKAGSFKAEVTALKNFQELARKKSDAHTPDVAPQVPQDDAAKAKDDAAKQAAEAKAKQQAAAKAKFDALPSSATAGSARAPTGARPESPTRATSMKAGSAQETGKAQGPARNETAAERPATHKGQSASMRAAPQMGPQPMPRGSSMRAAPTAADFARAGTEIKAAQQQAKAAAEALAKNEAAKKAQIAEAAMKAANDINAASAAVARSDVPQAQASVDRADQHTTTAETRAETVPAAAQPAINKEVEKLRDAADNASLSVSSVAEKPASGKWKLSSVGELTGATAQERLDDFKNNVDFQMNKVTASQAKKILWMVVGLKKGSDDQLEGHIRTMVAGNKISDRPFLKQLIDRSPVNSKKVGL